MTTSIPSPAEFERFRPNLTGHCYRMLGSVFDADDAVQETLVRAWRRLDAFEGRSELRTWLYRIATNVCLDFLAERKRRARPIDEAPAGKVGDELLQRPSNHWLEPIPDIAVLPSDADPHERAALKESTRLAFVAALQHLPGKQRAALLLTEVLGCTATEAADCLEISVPALNSALQRARARLETCTPVAQPLTAEQSRQLERYVAAFEAFDVDTLVSLLHDDAKLSMPPYCLWLVGPEEIRRWLLGPGNACRGSRLVPIDACGSPAFAQYRPNPAGGFAPWAIIVLELEGDRVVGWNTFLDTEALFPRFGLPLALL
ncbi:MAG TPA: sigma-70 family RNA polymerase sigma factor [Polyangiaceae bacterium]